MTSGNRSRTAPAPRRGGFDACVAADKAAHTHAPSQVVDVGLSTRRGSRGPHHVRAPPRCDGHHAASPRAEPLCSVSRVQCTAAWASPPLPMACISWGRSPHDAKRQNDRIMICGSRHYGGTTRRRLTVPPAMSLRADARCLHTCADRTTHGCPQRPRVR
jgi:hypothetical protein